MKISEIFYSLQGEGAHTGKPAIFIRFYGCNLNCAFCDEPLHLSHFREMEIDQILEEIQQFPAKFIVITGGEPSIQNLEPLISRLKKKGYYIAVETNGFDFQNIAVADWITYSPKNWNKIKDSKKIGEFKFVVNKHSDLKPILNLLKTFDGPIFIQPEGEGQDIIPENIEFCIEFIKQNPTLRLSLQTHKLLNIP